MKILELQIKSFGKLADKKLSFGSGVNVLSQANGFGKSTIASFIRAMFYGVDYQFKGTGDEKKNDITKFAPWNKDNSKFGGAMIVQADNQKSYRIERFFGNTKRSEELLVTDLSTGKAVDLQEMSVGEYFLGLTCESYDRSTFFPQESVEISSNENLEQKLANLVENNAEDFDKVRDRLIKYKKERKLDRGNGGKIFNLQNEITVQQQKIIEAKQQNERKVFAEQQLKEINLQKDILTKEKESILAEKQILTSKKANYTLSQSDKEIQSTFNQAAATVKKYPNFNLDKQSLDDLSQKIDAIPQVVPQKAPQTKPYLLYVLSALLVLGGVLLAVLVNLIAGLITSAVGIAVFVVSLFIAKRNKQNSVVTLQATERDHLITDYFKIAQHYGCQSTDFNQLKQEIQNKYSNYCYAKNTVENLAKAVRTENSAEISKIDDAVAKIDNRCREIDREINSLSEQFGGYNQILKQNDSDVSGMQDRLNNLCEQMNIEVDNYNVAQTTLELLEKAKENLSQSYVPALAESCTKLIKQVTNCNLELTLDNKFTIKLRQDGFTKSLSAFSRGTREITLLCFRIALSQMLFGGTIPLLIVDDAFVNYDEQNFVRATQLLQSLASNGTQVLYFTCHNRTGALTKSN